MEIGNLWMVHKARILTILSGIALLLLSMIFYYSIISTQPKHITLTVDGVAKAYETQADTVEQFLAEQNIKITDHDILTPAATTRLSDAQTVQLQTSWAVPIQVDGQTKVVHTVKRDVQSILKDAGITLRKLDKVLPALHAKISKGSNISVTRVDEQIVKVEKVIPFQEFKKEDKSLTKGERRILNQGQEGKALLHYKVVTENGKETARQLVKTEVVTPKKDRMVAIGTRNKERAVFAAALSSRSGSLKARRVLHSVTMTAYSPADGTITATGTKATVGRTIAVDPSVIPLGWWVYIEGIGYRRAEDTGGAIKGNKIDVYLASDSQARQFGRRKAKTVHIIGPKLP